MKSNAALLAFQLSSSSSSLEYLTICRNPSLGQLDNAGWLALVRNSKRKENFFTATTQSSVDPSSGRSVHVRVSPA
jgi:hypothetical protein